MPQFLKRNRLVITNINIIMTRRVQSLMNILPAQVRQSPGLVRAVPFLIFVALTTLQPYAGVTGRYWLYFAKTVAGAAMIWSMYPLVSEMRWKWSGAAVIA